MATRRAVLRAGALLPLTAACAPAVFGARSDAVRIAVSWGGSELDAFESVLHALGFEHPTEVIPLGDDIGTVFGAGRSAPDIVMLPQAGQVRKLAEHGRLRAFDDAMWTAGGNAQYADGWRSLLKIPTAGDRFYGVPFKMACKSLIWYDRPWLRKFGLPDPETWSVRDWPVHMDALAGSGVSLLALGAADGWVLTDFFENVLWAEYPEAYDRMANPALWLDPRGQPPAEIESVLRDLAAVWSHRHAFPGDIGKTLTRQFPDAVRDVFQHHSAIMVVAPDFAEPIVRGCVAAAELDGTVGVAAFPGARGSGGAPLIAGGDVMVVTDSAKDSAIQLASLLAQPTAPLPWITRYGGFVAANQRTPRAYSPLIAPTATRFEQWTAFDLGDRIGSSGGRFELWRVLTEFLTQLDTGGVDSAVRHTAAAIDALQRRRGD
ncbi:extracellular solute-binding protein [Nocardia sp. SYP-A9097]|uniref:ABC transporter substrate-binding protein n=1 Tax=Nocardia sp. SYP-A9097 TaxID=2663237 RepID=UPI00129A892A|nr:ABC transporter substrate-binding protein [Nocardia sp. SYP-A9097]MRH92623.1 extracellular solute-binding protein [Nocardia sp. SYP-A9097]